MAVLMQGDHNIYGIISIYFFREFDTRRRSLYVGFTGISGDGGTRGR
jgi:hypothetical protein